jgi:hypothetical protein
MHKDILPPEYLDSMKPENDDCVPPELTQAEADAQFDIELAGMEMIEVGEDDQPPEREER